MASTLLNMMAGGDALGSEGAASDQGKLSSAEGIATATQNTAASAASENTSKTTPVATAAASAAAENTSKTTPVATAAAKGSPNTGQAQAGANAGAQAKTAANGQSAAAADVDVAAPVTTVETQAAGIAKAIGDGNRAQVTVTVTNEAQTLTSKPNAALTTNAVISGEGSSQSSSGRQAGTHTPNRGTQGQVAQAAVQQAQAGQNQAAGNSGVQTGAAAKGLVQAQGASAAASGGTVHAGGGVEGVTQAGGVSGTQQAQNQAAAEQATNARKTASTGRSVAEQISVKITKAIQAGTDKITIQLRPANMGRVEVKLEIGLDNRLTALVIADNRETLEILQKDARELQRALQDAGLQADSGDLNFSLRGEENQARDEESASSGRPLTGDEDIATLEEMIVEEAVIASDGRVLANGRIDIRA